MKSKRVSLVFLVIFAFGCEKFSLDKQMKELCAKDGGVKVYETVKLPPEMFDQYGRPFPGRSERKLSERFGPEYIYETTTTVLNEGDPLAGQGRLERIERKILRLSDRKTLGRSVVYVRLGGDFIPLGHPSGKTCPSGKETLARDVFIQGENNVHQ